jgi:hypothetical protein
MSANGTTNVYKLRHGEGYEWLLPVDSNDYDLLNFDGKPRGSSWKPILTQRLKTDDGRLSDHVIFRAVRVVVWQ